MGFKKWPTWLKGGIIVTIIYVAYSIYYIYFSSLFGNASWPQVKFLFLFATILISFIIGVVCGLVFQVIMSENKKLKWFLIATLIILFVLLNLYIFLF